MKVLPSHALQLIQRVLAHESKWHQITRIVLLVKQLEFFNDARYIQRLSAPDPEPIQNAARSGNVLLFNRTHRLNLRAQPHLIFAVYCVNFSIDAAFCEQGVLEKLWVDVEGFVEFVILHFKVIISVVLARHSIRVASMLRQELLIVVLHGVLSGTQKEHVLAKMRQSVNPRPSSPVMMVTALGITETTTPQI